MNKISTLVVSAVLALNFFSATTANAQTPVFKFCKPKLKSGVDKQQGAVYFFDKVYTTVTNVEVDAYVTLVSLKNGATLTNIDDSASGYYNAWQPTVTAPNAVGSAQIDWMVEFKNNAGVAYTFSDFEFAAIDVDGDGAKVQEYVTVSNYSLYFTPPNIVSALTLINLGNSGPGTTNHKSLGPVANRPDIDTSSLDVKINYLFTNKNKFFMSTGVQVNATGGANSRFFSIYPIDAEILNVLPVKITSFDAFSEGNKAILKWNTEQEVNHDHFEVERSFDNVSFKTVAMVLDGITNANGSKGYSYKDAAADLTNHNVVYYRLKQVDNNQKFTYSTIRMVRFANSEINISASPNPYVETLRVNFTATEKGNAEIKLVNINGTTIVQKNMVTAKGNNTMVLNNLSTIQTGVYIVTVSMNGKVIGKQQVIK